MGASDTPVVTGEPKEPPTGDPLSLITRANNIVFAVDRLQNQWTLWRAARAERNTYTVSIGSSDRFYYQLQTWLVKQIRSDNQRNLKGFGTSTSLRFHFDDSNAQWITVDGHRIKVSSEKPKNQMETFKAELLNNSADQGPPEPQLVFVAQSKEGFEAIKAKLVEVREAAMKVQVDPPRLHFFSGYWGDSSAPLRPRSVDSVVLGDGQMERIIDDFERFLNDEKVYVERGIPYHRGYLFYGPPGTGKTSLAKALAGHFNLDLYYIPLGSIPSDTELTKTISRVGEKSIVLFEDVDVFNGVKDREGDAPREEGRSFSLSGFLNILDGVMTPHGLIKILTTNDPDVIDPAVLRAGRIDRAEELGLLTTDQSDRMFEVFYSQKPEMPLNIEGVSPSRLNEIMKSHMYDPHLAEKEIREMIK